MKLEMKFSLVFVKYEVYVRYLGENIQQVVGELDLIFSKGQKYKLGSYWFEG